MKTFLILFSFLLLTNRDVIHKDTPLQIDKNGNIIGLPNEYSPAKFDEAEKILQIRNRIIVFPECITEYFEEYKNVKLNLSASWYHSKDIMPFYLNFEISDYSTDYSHSILINLETLELIKVYKVYKETRKGISFINEIIKLDKNCLNQYKNGIKITY